MQMLDARDMLAIHNKLTWWNRLLLTYSWYYFFLSCVSLQFILSNNIKIVIEAWTALEQQLQQLEQLQQQQQQQQQLKQILSQFLSGLKVICYRRHFYTFIFGQPDSCMVHWAHCQLSSAQPSSTTYAGLRRRREGIFGPSLLRSYVPVLPSNCRL